MKRTLRGRWRVIVGSAILTAIPTLASAHGLTGSGGWVDELICLVPALIMVALVLILGKDNKKRGAPKDPPRKSSQ